MKKFTCVYMNLTPDTNHLDVDLDKTLPASCKDFQTKKTGPELSIPTTKHLLVK